MKKVEYHNIFIYYTKYKFSSVILTLIKPDAFLKIDLKAFFFFSTKNKNFQKYSGL